MNLPEFLCIYELISYFLLVSFAKESGDTTSFGSKDELLEEEDFLGTILLSLLEVY